ncbi:Laminin subunit beta-1 variant [Armadillidium vulgare]|nr:Laminin subunit beta-1 variant [Armadillidium vulgare]
MTGLPPPEMTKEGMMGEPFSVGMGTITKGQSPGTRIISRKKTTKTTKITKTRIDGSSEPKTTSYTYTYTYPGSSVTTFRNTSTFITKTGQKPISESERRRISSTYESSSGSSYDGDSVYKKQFSSSVGSGGSISGSSQSVGNVDSSYRIGVGEEYLKNTEEDVYDYEEEVYDPEFARGPVVSPEDLLHPFVIRGFGAAKGYKYRNENPCDGRSCYPSTGNLLIGRLDKLSATSTCGLQKKEKYCIVSFLDQRKKCFWCDSRDAFVGNPRYSHRIQNVLSRFDPRTRLPILVAE